MKGKWSRGRQTTRSDRIKKVMGENQGIGLSDDDARDRGTLRRW